MPDVVVPMSLEDAISWEIAGAFAGILGIVMAVILWGLVFIVIGSVAFLIYAIYLLLNKKIWQAVLSLMAWAFCALVVWSFAGPRFYKNKFQAKVADQKTLSFYDTSTTYPTPSKLNTIYWMKDGRVMVANSQEAAINGQSRAISSEEIKELTEESLKSTLLAKGKNAYPTYDAWVENFLDVKLSPDFHRLTVVVSNNWHRQYDTSSRYSQLGVVYLCYVEAIKGYSVPGALDFIAKMEVYNQKGILLATGETDSPMGSPGFNIIVHMDGKSGYGW